MVCFEVVDLFLLSKYAPCRRDQPTIEQQGPETNFTISHGVYFGSGGLKFNI